MAKTDAPLPDTPPGFRSGFVGILGKPNVGKSTLLNALLGRKIAITSPRPQTTRSRILGILTRGATQIVFMDTPGWHQPKDTLGKYMIGAARNVMEEADLSLVVVDATSRITQDDQRVFDIVRTTKARALSVINKVDAVKKALVLPLIDELEATRLFAEHVPVSAAKGDNLDRLLERITSYLPEGPRWYEADQLTDQSSEQIIREFIREEVLRATRDEVPHAVAVLLEEVTPKEKVTLIRATILVERDGQKAIVIGKGGAMLKLIGQQARLHLERWLGRRIFLELWVKVAKSWREDPSLLRELGYQG